MAKRGNGEGSIYEERPGRWVALVNLGYEVRDGKRRRVRKKFIAGTRKAVQNKLTEALREQQTGGIVPIEKDTLGVFLRAWIETTLKAKGRAEKTLESYRWMAEHYIVPELGHVPLTRLTQVMLNDFMNRKLESGLSARTVRYSHAIIRSALSKAEKDGLVGRNVARLAEPPGEKKVQEVGPLTPDEARKFLTYVQGHRLEALYSVAIAIGLRRGEALGLQWSGVDLARGTVQVSQTIQRIKGRGMVTRRAAKTEKSLRLVPLPAFAVAKLQQHREQQQREKLLAGDRWQDTGLVFSSSIGSPLEPSNLTRHFHAALAALKIDRRRFHDLRHTAASLLLAQGATLHDVKEILGHSQIALTANLYGHAYTSVLRQSVDLVGSILAPENPVAPQLAPLQSNRKPS